MIGQFMMEIVFEPEMVVWVDETGSDRLKCNWANNNVGLASYPGSFEGAEKRAWSTLSAHAFNFLLLQDSVIFSFMFVLCIRMMTLLPVSVMDYSSGVDYALRCLGSPEIRLKPEQITSIKGIYEGKDVFTWLPTGFGKSIFYQVLPFLFDVKLCQIYWTKQQYCSRLPFLGINDTALHV